MSMSRRGFLAGVLAASAAPAFVRAESLMKIVVPSKDLILPEGYILADGSIYSKASEMLSMRQDHFGELFFPTILITPETPDFYASGVLVKPKPYKEYVMCS